MRPILRLVLLAVAAMGLFGAHWVTARRMGAPAGLVWDWFVLGYSGVGINPSLAALLANLAAAGAATVLGLCLGMVAGKSMDIQSSPTVLMGEVMACGVLDCAILFGSMEWWNRPSVIEALALGSFLICSYGISRMLILSVWAAQWLRKHRRPPCAWSLISSARRSRQDG